MIEGCVYVYAKIDRCGLYREGPILQVELAMKILLLYTSSFDFSPEVRDIEP